MPLKSQATHEIKIFIKLAPESPLTLETLSEVVAESLDADPFFIEQVEGKPVIEVTKI